MRIIGGKFRGRTLVSFNGENIRPTSDKARESLFNILRERVEGCVFLDVFAGTGAVGIEAFSRGAAEVYLIDSAKESVSVILKNVEKIGSPAQIKVFNQDGIRFLSGSAKPFDIIFVDPPYKSDLAEQAVRAAFQCGALSRGGVLVLETETEYCGEYLKYVVDTRKYGRARFTFFREDIK